MYNSSAAPQSGSGCPVGSDINAGILGCRHVAIKLVWHSAVRFTEGLQQEKGRKKEGVLQLMSSCKSVLFPSGLKLFFKRSFASEPSSHRLQNLSLHTDGASLVSLADREKLGLISSGPYLPQLQRLEERNGEASQHATVSCPGACSRFQGSGAWTAATAAQRGLTARGSAGEEVGHDLSFALDCDHASVLQCVVVGAQNLLQVRSHLKASRRKQMNAHKLTLLMLSGCTWLATWAANAIAWHVWLLFVIDRVLRLLFL